MRVKGVRQVIQQATELLPMGTGRFFEERDRLLKAAFGYKGRQALPPARPYELDIGGPAGGRLGPPPAGGFSPPEGLAALR